MPDVDFDINKTPDYAHGCCQICCQKAPTEKQVQLEPRLSDMVGVLGFEP
jgi:hypothetical protein